MSNFERVVSLSRLKTFMLALIMILSIVTALAQAKQPLSTASGIQAIAWEQQGRVKLAVANTSYLWEELTVEFGYHSLGRRIIDEYSIGVPPMTILVTIYPKAMDQGVSGYRAADTIYISDVTGRQVASTQIIGIHAATGHYRIERYLVPAGQEAVAYLQAPDPDLGIDTKVYLGIGKTYRLGDYTGRLTLEVSQGGLMRERRPPLEETETLQDFYNYSYGWRGLVIKASTPKLEGVERLDWDMEKFISTPEGTVRHGLSAPPILVYGPDMTLVEE